MRVERNGFTLLELLVALAVFAIAALALLQMEGASISRTADLDQRLLREIVAQNMAAEILSDPAPPSTGTATGTITNAGRSFQWTRAVAPLADYGVLGITLTVRETTPGATSQAFTLDFTRLPGA
ncbi:type II secretion system minor pseudopilin GspI [Novosphingobium sp. SL115]|uniref:type II secretion system minor pseudopilin GspI n=1 Tax=Novosphingobium sp. SL115 TaxID=2995150 RepID=UPI0022756DC9|nr:type II secretion system minor pseudopilin GspI [Novosphingobium sp. SL115]MCY1671268.1 type II secretion system minor pseudopilin GspI [Novosphingobium sp. SL115]